MKKKIAYFLVAALSVSMLAGCGSKSGSGSSSSGESAKSEKVTIGLTEVLGNIAEAATGIEAVNISATGEADIVVSAQGQEMTITGSIDLSGNAAKDEPAFDVSGTAKYDLDMGGQSLSGDYSLEAYAEAEDDEMTVYSQINNFGWEKSSMDKSEFDEAFEQIESSLESMKDSLADISEEDLKDAEKYIKLEDKTKTVNGKECYVLTMDLDKDTIVELAELGNEMTEEYSDEEFDDYLDTFDSFDKFNITMSLYFDKETYLPAKMSMDIAMDGEVEGESISVNKLTFDIVIGVNDKVTVKSVPEEAKENAVEEDDDYDFDDYDFED